MNEASTKRDLLKNDRASSVLWGLPIATIVLTGYFVKGGWIVTISWTIALAVMGIACVVNARGCGRMHCYLTGPFFLLLAIVSLLHGLRVLWLGPNGWSYIGAVLAFGGILLCAVPEWLFGRYRSARDRVG